MKDSVPTMNPLLVMVTVVLIGGIFVIDIFVPTGVLVPLLYTIPLLITLLAPQRSLFLATAAASTLLTVLGFFLSAPGGIFWMAVTNRSLAVLSIGVATGFCLLHRKVAARLKTLEDLLPFCSACRRVRDDRGYWKQLELYLEEHSGTQFSRGFCPECAPKHFEVVLS
jgi:hypothetical protein